MSESTLDGKLRCLRTLLHQIGAQVGAEAVGDAIGMLNAYADLREQIERAREGVKAWMNSEGGTCTAEAKAAYGGGHLKSYDIPLYTHLLPSGECGGVDADTTLRQAARVDEDTFVQPVPDHCDRIVWRGKYYGLAALEAALAQPAQVAGVELTARPCEAAAERAIEHFLADELGSVPSFTLAEDGEPSDGEKCGWSFWITEDGCEDDTTSYVHADLSIEWYGTAWEVPTAEPVAQAEADIPTEHMADDLQAILDGERPRLNKTEMREYVRDLRALTAQPHASPEQPAGRQGEAVPKAIGVSRHAEMDRSLLVFFSKSLTDDERRAFHDYIGATPNERSDVWIVQDETGQPIHCASWPRACHEHINDAINEHGIDEAKAWKVIHYANVTRPAAPVGVPDAADDEFVPRWWDSSHGDAYKEGWNDCRIAAINLAAAPSSTPPTTGAIGENGK